MTASSDGHRVANDYASVRLGARVAHAIAGRTTRGEFLTLCGRMIDSTDPRVREGDIREVAIHQHCLSCWG